MATNSNKSLIAKDFSFCDKTHFNVVKGISILIGIGAWFLAEFFGKDEFMPLIGMAGAVFLFCSGYGVSESFNNKRGLVHYWENKVMRVWLPSVVAMIIISMLEQQGNPLGWMQSSPIGLKDGWLYVLLGSYGVFWLVFRFLKEKDHRILLLFCTAILMYAFLEELAFTAMFFCFPVGVMFSQYGIKYTVREFRWWQHVALLLCCIGLAVGGWFARRFVSEMFVRKVLWSLCFIGASLVLLFLSYYLRKLKFIGLFAPVGMISYGLYLAYDRVLMLMKGHMEWRVITVVVLMLVALASLYSWLVHLLVQANKNSRRRRRTKLKGSMW